MAGACATATHANAVARNPSTLPASRDACRADTSLLLHCPQVSSGAFIGTAALASIAVFHVLRALLHAASDALFVTYVFPRECSVRAPPPVPRRPGVLGQRRWLPLC